jgi:hypothetical protein
VSTAAKNRQAIEAALRPGLELFQLGFRPVIVYPAGFDHPKQGVRTGKEPFGKEWGIKPIDKKTLERDVRYFTDQDFVPGWGICLGPGRAPDGKALADIEGDSKSAEESRLALFGGQTLQTMGHTSARGKHMFVAYDWERVQRIVGALGEYETRDQQQPGVYHLPEMPGLELRLGGVKADGALKQLQSVVPPTPGTDGKPREWNGVLTIAEVPESFYQVLERAAAADHASPTSSAHGARANGTGNGRAGDRVDQWLRKALEATYGHVAMASVGERHDTLMKRTRMLSGYLHYNRGFTENELLEAMVRAADEAAPERKGDNPRCVRDAIANGKAMPLRLPDELHDIATGVAISKMTAKSANSKPGSQGRTAAEEDDEYLDYRALSDTDLGIVPLRSFKSSSIDWLWKYRLVRGALALMVGDGGLGKSMLLLWIAMIVSRARTWPDRSGDAPLGRVVIVSAEDDPRTTIKPRLEALGADIDRITIVKAKYIIRREKKPPLVHPATLSDRSYWLEIFRRIQDCVLFIVDPLPSYLGRGINDSKNVEIRSVLEPFIEEVIGPLGICMIGNTHINKSVDAKTPMHRISGSIAYGNLPRNVHFVVRDPDVPGRRYFKQAKCNNAPDDLPAIAFQIQPQSITNEDGEEIETTIPVFDADPVNVDLAQAVIGGARARAKPGPEPVKTMALAEWLFDFLTDQPAPTPLAAVFDAAGEAGHVGERKNGRWTNLSALYRAMEKVAELPAPRAGRCVDGFRGPAPRSGREIAYWRLLENDSEPAEETEETETTSEIPF